MVKKTTEILSIIITAHNEGLIAHKTMLSVFSAIEKIRDVPYEIIVSIDNGDQTTLDYFSRYKDDPKITLLHVDFKDLSSSRNNAALVAKGKYLTFLDADDLVSSNWYIYALKTIGKHTGAIVHPEYSITFGDDNLIWQKQSSSDKANDTLLLIDNNLWDSPCLAERDIFMSYPYHPNGNGFGYEDKHFNTQTLAADIEHIIAPKTILFVRRKVTGSMLRAASSDLVTVAKNDLFSYQNIKNIQLDKYIQKQTNNIDAGYQHLSKLFVRKSKHLALKVHNHAKRYDTYLSLTQPLRKIRHEKNVVKLQEQYPSWMIESWKYIHKIDNQIFPSIALLKSLSWYNSRNIVPGVKYTELVQSFTKKPDTLFFVPHLIKGGADMLFINYSTEIVKQHGDWHIAMLQTEAKQSVWNDKLPKEIDFINLYQIFNELDINTQNRLLATLIVQNNIKRIIIGNSQQAYDFVSQYQTLIKTLDIAIYCFAFGEEFDEEGRLWGHIHTGIPRVYPVIYRIITDNLNTVNKLEKEYAFSRDKFKVHYQPTSVEVMPTTQNNDKPVRILWASRVCKQKRPDILKAVSNKLDPKEFLIDAYGQLEEGLTENYFNDSKVRYRGPFNGPSTIPTKDYDIFIYTSEGDGVPNILQEMTAAGLPIVASNVGGIGEFIITNNTGFLINDHEKIDDYVAAIYQLKDARLRKRLNDGAQYLLATQFSHTTWRKKIEQDIDK